MASVIKSLGIFLCLAACVLARATTKAPPNKIHRIEFFTADCFNCGMSVLGKITVDIYGQAGKHCNTGLLDNVGKDDFNRGTISKFSGATIGKCMDARWRSESDLKEGDGQRSSPALSGYSPSLLARYSPGASSSSSHASRKHTPPLLGARLRAGSDPSIARPDPTTRLEPGIEDKTGRGLAAKLSPRLGSYYQLNKQLTHRVTFRKKK